jgi:hypothetical protein
MPTTLEALDAMASGFTIANVTPFGSPRGRFVVQLVPPGIRPGAPVEVDVTNVVSQQMINDAIDDVSAVIFTKEDSIGNLNGIDLDTAFIIGNDTEAEDELSSVILIGPPRRKVEAFNARHFSNSEGEMEIVVGRELLVLAADLHRAASRVSASVFRSTRTNTG